ncbi:Tox-REase-5 domain-containing protein [Paraburkholderia tropica]|uniref:Filamentous hemagglutinin n=1 Tax=Paraburkholderia tropica TaxID=92647 RepID=A0ABX5MBD0_9BURK|nr:Tox-REase-5 domain-containing protein [Paraburkholderia tropica]PXX04224.1 filamentous hemagglutinin [Paraburkholderia tropica]PZW69510.1 filamentous hemagglutinin [Paraburkholderia tropica]
MRNGEAVLAARAIQRAVAAGRLQFECARLTPARHALWRRVTAAIMAVVMYLAPAVLLCDEVARAAPIVDPRAPVPFQPTITQSSGGAAVINIPAPNANGLSVSQFQSFSVGAQGVIFNNSLVSGTSLNGGQVSANPNLAGRTASTILAQVTSTGSQYASVIAGPLEVFGNSASLIIANPNGISIPGGTTLTNISNLTLTTGVPQFITTAGGTPTTWDNAGALAWSVNGGNISINGPPGNDGTPGAGIAGTVGNIDLIGQTISLNAPIQANDRVNVIAGNQLVTPSASASTGTTYTTASSGSTNAAAATGNGSVAIDASQYGSVTSGTIFIVSTAAGMGVNMQGPLAATAGNAVVNANGDITVGQTFASRNVNLSSAGATNITGTSLANQNYTVSANGDINASAPVSAGQNVSLAAGANLGATSVAANGSATLNAVNSMTVGSVSGDTLALQATTGDLTVNSALTAPGTISASAGHDLSINGQVQGGSTVALSGGNNVTVKGAVSSVGEASLTATAGTASVAGNLQSNAVASVSAGQNIVLGGTTQAQGAVTLAAQLGSISGSGDLASSQDAVSLTAGLAIGLTGNVQAGTDVTASAATTLSMSGAVTAPGTVTLASGGDATLGGNLVSGAALSVNAGGNVTLNGVVGSVGNMALTAGGTLTTASQVTSLGTLAANGQQGVSLGGTVYSGGNAQVGSSAGTVSIAGSLTGPGTIAISAGQDATVTGSVHSGDSATVTATRDANLDGGLEVDGTGNATVTAGRNLNGTGAISVASNTTLSAGNNLTFSGAIETGNNLSATAGQNLAVGTTTTVGTQTLTATSGSATLGNALSGGAMNVTAGTDVNAQGTAQSLGNLAISALGGNFAAAGAVSTAGTATLNAGQNLTLDAQTTVSNDATLTGANITTQGLAVGGNLTATATNHVDTSAGQLNAAYSTSAPALEVTGNATLAGASVTTANAVIGGTYSATGTTSLTTGGTAAYMGSATLAGGTVTNVGTQMAQGNLAVSGSLVTNQGALSSLETMALTAANLVNSGTIYGPDANLTVSGATTNTGGLLGTNALTLTTGSLANSSLIYAGDTSNPAAATGDTSVTVTGGNGSYNNANGQILGQNSVTLALPDQSVDPSSSAFGTVIGGNALSLSAKSVSNSGTWTLPDTAVTVSASGGISNTGTINQGTGSLTLNGTVSNAGTLNGHEVTVNGALANAAGATVQAGDAFTLAGSGTNAGTVEAVNQISISGTAYNNSNGTTAAGNSSSASGAGNMAISLTGDLVNAGGKLSATNNLTIAANDVINSGATGTGGTTTTTTTVANPGLALGLTVGSDTVAYSFYYGSGDEGFYCCTTWSYNNPTVTLADALSPTGVADPTSIDALTAAVHVSWAKANVQPAAISGNTITFVEIPTPDANGNIENLWFVETAENAAHAIATKTIDLPTATETITTTGGGASSSSVIAAGNDLSLTANTLNNQSGTVSAGHDASVSVQSLDNSGTSYSSTVTDTVDLASLNAFLAAAPSTISVWGSFHAADGTSETCASDRGFCITTKGITLDAPGTVTPVSTSSSITVQGATGQIVAGHNVNLSGGDLVNAGTITAANDVNVSANSFTNQGTSTGTVTTTVGCAAGYTGCNAAATSNNNSQTYSYQQINSNVTAGNDIVIAANTVNNTYGNLVAGRNVVIGGTGTTASDSSTSPTNITRAASVTNTSGSLAAGNDADINAATLTNTIAAPVQIHQNYGSATPFTGCTFNCEAWVDVQSASAATIVANHDVNLSAGSFANTGSLITGLNNVTISATAAATSDNQYLNAYWHASSGANGSTAWGCANNPALCASLYGSAWNAGQAQDPAGLPSSVGLPDFVPGTIQAGNTLAVRSPTLANTGNVIGQTVSLSGSTLVNGLTNPNVYTPPPAVSGQVITLGPPSVPSSATTTINAAGQVTNLSGERVSVTGTADVPQQSLIGATTVGSPSAPAVSSTTAPAATSVTTVSGQTLSVSYLVNSPAAAVTSDLSPAALLSQLPASLQPDTTQFYYDPYTQAQQVEQAALQATGNASFYALPSTTDATSQTSVSNLDTAALYGAALQYAEQNNVALGTQLSQTQLALVNEPMLWYVEETVPEPGCTATGNGVCPTVQALMPEVLLPQNFAQVNADGTITGTNVALDYANSILNTGTVTAENLSVDTGSLTNEQRSTNVGTIYELVTDGLLAKTTGTVVQQGGYMSAANYQLNVDTLTQIGGALTQVNADGSENAAATSQLLANLKSQLGNQFTQTTASDNLHTELIGAPSTFDTIFQMAVIVAIAVMSAGAASAGIGAAAGAGSTLSAVAPGVAAGLGNASISAAVGGLVSNSLDQVAFGNGSFSVGSLLEAGATAFVTAGLTNGITYANGALGFTTTASSNSLAALAGVQSVGNVILPGASAASGSALQTALALGAITGIQAGVQSAIEGSSFLTDLRDDGVANLAAAAAFSIGNAKNGGLNEGEYVAAHAALGCAASAAEGTGCAGGAIGGATSAALSPLALDAIDPTHAPLDSGQLAALAAFATLAGGGLAGLVGVNVTGAMTAAQNEALNNAADHWEKPGQQQEAEKYTLKPTPQGAPIDEEQAQQGGGGGTDAEAITTGQGAAGAIAGATNSTTGSWISVNESMSAQAQAYQTQITGVTGQAYVVNGVKFDGVSNNGTLLDAKGPGYANFVGSNGQFQPWFNGQSSLISQAIRQLGAAQGQPIQWSVAEPSAATAIQNLFNANGITGISIINQPPK